MVQKETSCNVIDAVRAEGFAQGYAKSYVKSFLLDLAKETSVPVEVSFGMFEYMHEAIVRLCMRRYRLPREIAEESVQHAVPQSFYDGRVILCKGHVTPAVPAFRNPAHGMQA